MSKALVLLSGGLDSTTCLYLAKKNFDEVAALSVNYGQRHAKEIDCASKVCALNLIPHWVHEIPKIENVMLTDPEAEVPDISYDQIEGVSPTYVPFRNGLLLGNVASLAQARGFDAIYFGAHSEDAKNWAYPDCTPEFIGAIANAIHVGTYFKVRLYTPLQWLMKSEIVTLGNSLEVPFEMTWSCYKGEDLHCGVCPTCRSRKQAFIDAGVEDPTVYAA